MKIDITNASAFVDRMFVSCGPYQWAREFLKNSIEAAASRVEFGIEWQGVEKLGVYRRTIMDDGIGMDREELTRFFKTLGLGSKTTRGVHDNFGIGAKIASLPWNSQGLVVISYKNGIGSMIDILVDNSGDYHLMEFDDGDEKCCCIDPVEFDGIDWSLLRPKWVTEHGTIIVLLGSKEYPNTVMGNERAGETSISGLARYLNARFWDLSTVGVRVAELASNKYQMWPRTEKEFFANSSGRPYARRVWGSKHYLEVKDQQGVLPQSGIVSLLDDRLKIGWYLWTAQPVYNASAKSGSYIGIKYKDEIFEIKSDKATMRTFGITEGKVQSRLSLIIEPQQFDGKWGVSPDQSRTRIVFTGSEDRSVPLNEWGIEFAHNMPQEIREALRLAREAGSGSIQSEEYRKRLQDKFGARWSMSVQMAKLSDSPTVTVGDTVAGLATSAMGGEQSGRQPISRPAPVIKPTVKVVRNKAKIDSKPLASPAALFAPVDVPRFRKEHKDSFDKSWHLASWAPNDPDGPTVLLNLDSPILEESIRWHQERYHDVVAEEVARIVIEVFGEVACCKIAHSQKLIKYIPEEEISLEYRNDAALTISLMGLLAEDTLITQRLSGLGVKGKSDGK